MFSKLRKKKHTFEKVYRLLPNMRIYAIGDIHGRYDCLEALHNVIIDHSQKYDCSRKLVVYLGDYVDRGHHVRETLDELIHRPLPGLEAHHLMGNHEHMLLSFLKNAKMLIPWLDVGGMATLLSYGIKVSAGTSKKYAEDIRKELASAMPHDHINFIKKLAINFMAGDYLFVHAGIRPGVPLEKQDKMDMLTIREDFSEFEGDHGFRVVYGHSIKSEPVVMPNRIGIDSGAYATGVLTCAVLEGDSVEFLF